MNKKYAVRLSEEERAYANEVLHGSETASSYRKRANVLLIADERMGKPMRQAEIAARCGVSDVTVYHTIRDYSEKRNRGNAQLCQASEPASASNRKRRKGSEKHSASVR